MQAATLSARQHVTISVNMQDMECLHRAAEDGDLHTAEGLLARGVDVNATEVLACTCQALLPDALMCTAFVYMCAVYSSTQHLLRC